jgi:cyclohexyl-isocyanide hydratase
LICFRTGVKINAWALKGCVLQMDAKTPFRVGLLVFPNITQLDLTGPWEVFSGMPGSETLLVWKRIEPVTAAKGLALMPTTTFADCPPLDLICIPGGPGMNVLLNDDETLEFIRAQAQSAMYVTSVCTGSLVLGAAGLLKGKRAASHWTSREMLSQFGAIPTDERVVRDGNLITGGGVTAGIDFALTIAAELHGTDLAKSIQLGIEYAPAPPFDAGTPQTAPRAIVDGLLAKAEPMLAARRAAVEMAAARLKA